LKNDIKNAFDQYATLDLYHAKASDIVFGYLEADNPAGHGLAVECGYAKGLGKTVIIVNETKLDDPMYRYKKFIEKSADIVFTNFVEGVLFLEKFQG
jgi:nucleoside 2-deoxyribosyltransferase